MKYGILVGYTPPKKRLEKPRRNNPSAKDFAGGIFLGELSNDVPRAFVGFKEVLEPGTIQKFDLPSGEKAIRFHFSGNWASLEGILSELASVDKVFCCHACYLPPKLRAKAPFGGADGLGSRVVYTTHDGRKFAWQVYRHANNGNSRVSENYRRSIKVVTGKNPCTAIVPYTVGCTAIVPYTERPL